MTQKINAKYKCNGKCKYATRQIQQRCNTETQQRRNAEMEKKYTTQKTKMPKMTNETKMTNNSEISEK